MLWYLLSQCDTNSFGWVRLVFFLFIHSVAFIIAIVVVGAVVVVVVRGSCYCCENVLKETNRFLLLFKIIKASPWWRWIESSLNKSAFHPYKVKVFNSLSIFPLSLQVLFFTRLRLNNHHIGNLNVCSFSLVKKIKFRRCFNLFNRKDNVDDFFSVYFQLYRERCLISQLKDFVTKVLLGTEEFNGEKLSDYIFFFPFFRILKRKTQFRRVSCPYLVLWMKKKIFLFFLSVFKWREIVSPLCVNDLNLVPFFPLLSFEFWP